MVSKMAHLDQRLLDINNGLILELLTEIEHATQVSRRGFETLPLFLYLTQCLYPNGGSEKRVPLRADMTPVTGLLGTRVEKLAGSTLYELCEELAVRARVPLEMNINKKLMTFINLTIPKFSQKKAKTSRF